MALFSPFSVNSALTSLSTLGSISLFRLSLKASITKGVDGDFSFFINFLWRKEIISSLSIFMEIFRIPSFSPRLRARMRCGLIYFTCSL